MIVFQNEFLFVANKPAGWLTTPARDKMDPRPCLGLSLQSALQMQIYPVHRLDFEVSGLVLFAKTPAAHVQAQSWFEHQRVTKTYEARSTMQNAEDRPAPSAWTEWRSQLVRGKRRTFEAAHGQPALTRVRRRADLIWELRPVTGRPHQLRVEMAKHGFPIDGDRLYGGRSYGGPSEERAGPNVGIALKAVSLNFSGIESRLGLPEQIAIEGLDDEWR